MAKKPAPIPYGVPDDRVEKGARRYGAIWVSEKRLPPAPSACQNL